MGGVCFGEVGVLYLHTMKKQLFFLFFIFYTSFSNAQSSLDSLRLVLPEGHTNSINSANLSPDNRLIITAAGDNYPRIFEVASGKEIHILKGHESFVAQATFSDDGKLVVTSGWDGTARIYEVLTGKELYIIIGDVEGEGAQGIQSAVFSSNGKFVLISEWYGDSQLYKLGFDKYVENYSGQRAIFSPDNKMVLTTNTYSCNIYKVGTKKRPKVLKGHSGYIWSSVFSPDGKFVLTAGADSTARIWEAESGKGFQILRGHGDAICSAEYSPNGKLVVTASMDGTAIIHDLESALEIKLIGHESGVSSAKFSPDGKLVLTHSDQTARIFDVATGNQISLLTGHTNNISSSKFSPDGKLAITTGVDNTVRIHKVSSGKLLTVLRGRTETANSVNYNYDGKKIIATLDTTICIFNPISAEDPLVISEESSIKSANFSPDGNLAIAFEYWRETVNIYEVASGRRILKIKDVDEVHNYKINSAVFSMDGKFIVTSSADKTARIFNAVTGEEVIVLKGHQDEVNSAYFSPNGELVITASEDNTSRIYEISTGKILKVLQSSDYISVKYAVFSFDGKLALTASDDNKVRIYEVNTGKKLVELIGHESGIYTAVFSPDSKLVLTASFDNSARIYDVTSGEQLYLLNGKNSWINSAVFSPDGSSVLTTSEHRICSWDVASGNPIYERIQLENNNWLVKLPNSPYYMCSKDASKMLHYVTPSLKVIGFEQLDPVYNRPDIVLDSIGKYFVGADQELVANYRQSWEKRIDRLGLDKEKLGKGEIAVPSAEIVGADAIAFENKAGKLDIKVSANDPKYPLRRFNVFVNEVPLYGSAGISIAHLKKQVWDTTVSVPLSLGENKIQVSVMNELGLENFKYPTYVNYTPENNVVAKTHYIGIGVNEFKEAEHNLKYCVKDVTDLAKSFGGANTEVKLFTDQQVTKENILALKEYLNKTSVNDKVIISCSSHGLLDDSLNFYLAMHDVDFNNPKARGLKYEALESLLDGIPARQKLLLLDACNSGENDKTEVLKKELQQKEKNMDSSQVLAARGVIIKLEEENKSNFKKMNELFVNVRNNTGSVIISAAGGQESALEAIEVDGKTIKNGAFTYSILECLKQNEGKELKVNALKQYAEKRVEEITNGKQKPTSRQETMEVDWGVR